MKSSVNSEKIPSPAPDIQKDIAYNNPVSPISEMRYRTHNYDNAPYEISIKVRNCDVLIDFKNCMFGESVSIPETTTESVYNPAFGEYNYNIQLVAICLKCDQSKIGEYLEAVYWGTPTDSNVKSFVKENARIVKSRYSLNSNYSSNISNRFTCTDVNAYTKGRYPNPWCRDSILLLYEKESQFVKIKNHPQLGVKNSKFSTVYNKDIVRPTDIY